MLNTSPDFFRVRVRVFLESGFSSSPSPGPSPSPVRVSKYASLFADDTNLTASGCSIIDIQTKLNNDLENIHQWLLANKLTLNKDKTEYMIAGSRQRISKIEGDPQVKLGNCNIKRVKETKTLDVIIDDQLKWNAHIDNVVTKVSKAIGMIRRMKNVVPQSTLISVYNAIVQPHFDYCSLVWDIANVYSLEKLQKMQNRAARVITGRSYEVRSETILQLAATDRKLKRE